MAGGSPCWGPWPWPGGAPGGGRIVVLVLDSADLDSAAAAIAGALGTPPALVRWGGAWGGLEASGGMFVGLGEVRGGLGGL